MIALLLAATLAAQQPATGVVQVTVEESMGMRAGFTVRSGAQSATTDAVGMARLVLPVGRQVIAVTRVGFKPTQVAVTIVRDSTVTARVTAEMSEAAMEMAEVKISATRIEKLAGETPIRVELVEEMEVEEKTLMSPSGIGMLLNETPGLRVFSAAPGLGTGSVRILGLPGQYTVMLADGLPLYGGSMSALGPLDISPVDLSRVEIIKGAASALYGGQSLGGVINLVSKPPTGKKEILFNRRMLGVTDAATWLSHRLGSGTGISLLGAGTLQSAEDVDNDGWLDQAKATRWSVRPRFHSVTESGRSLFVTAGYGFDDRDGGTAAGGLAPDGQPFREGLKSGRADIGATASIPTRSGGTMAMRFALSSNAREREFGSGPREDDRTSTGFLELTRLWVSARAATLIGTALQVDSYENKLVGAWNHDWFTPGLFFTTERNIGSFTLSASARADAHPDAGLQLTERLALLAKPAEGWSVRGSVGTGFAAATATTEETEATGLRSILAGTELKPEKSVGAMLDVNGRLLGAELLVTAYTSSISHAVQLNDPDGARVQARLQNAPSDTRISGVEGVAVWRFGGGKLIGTYGFSQGNRPNPMTGAREEMPMLPRHRIGGDLMMEKEGEYRWGIEGIWYGEQILEDNPYRAKSKPYMYWMAIVARQFGRVELVANFENLLDIKQTDSDPLVRRSRSSAGRWTTDAWAPLEGFMANVAIRYRWE
jgi:outer membrane receptor for ferrienterochelin and colicins